jgi:hypothetical protein
VACAVEKRPFTVAGQWRLFTALPEHLASELLFALQLQIKLLSSCPRVHALGITADAMKLIRIESKGKTGWLCVSVRADRRRGPTCNSRNETDCSI